MAERQVQPAREGYLTRVRENPSSHDCTIQIMGRLGEGKSAFINTYCAAVYGRWSMIAREAAFKERHVTHQLHHYFHQKTQATGIEGAKALSSSGIYAVYPLPSFRDFAGLDDRNSDEDELLIAALLFNTLEPGTSRADFETSPVLRFIQKLKIAEAVRHKMPTDRVFIVWSACNSIPQNFLTAFRNVRNMLNGSDKADESALLFGRVFLIITHLDKVECRDDFRSKKEKLKDLLGVPEFNVLEIENYNEDLKAPESMAQREQRSNPTIDLKVINFMDKVMNPAGGGLERAEEAWELGAWRSLRVANEMLLGEVLSRFTLVLMLLWILASMILSFVFHPITTAIMHVGAVICVIIFAAIALPKSTACLPKPRKKTLAVVQMSLCVAGACSRSLFVELLVIHLITVYFFPIPATFMMAIVLLRSPIKDLIQNHLS